VTTQTQADSTETEAGLIRRAAALIRAHGYNPSSPADSGPGYSVSSALCAAVRCNDPHLRHSPDCEDLHRRVVGYLYLTGQVRTPGTYMPRVLETWEEYQLGSGSRDQAEVLTVLERSAAILAAAAEAARLCAQPELGPLGRPGHPA
jgi:hypothetical protein